LTHGVYPGRNVHTGVLGGGGVEGQGGCPGAGEVRGDHVDLQTTGLGAWIQSHAVQVPDEVAYSDLDLREDVAERAEELERGTCARIGRQQCQVVNQALWKHTTNTSAARGKVLS